MTVQYKKRAKGGYYAYVKSEALGRTVCVIVTNHGRLQDGVSVDYWLASIGRTVKTSGYTRKGAVVNAVALLSK